MASKFQIREGAYGAALQEAESASDALLDFFADRRRGELRPEIETSDGVATVIIDGVIYKAVPVTHE